MGAILVAASLFVSFRPALAAEEAEDPARDQADAYVALVQADRLCEQSNFAQAVTSYRDALDRYNRISVKHPDWESEIVQYRLAYCANQIEMALKSTGKTEQELISDAAKSSATAEQESSRVAALMQENKYLRQRLSEVQEEIQSQEGAAVLASEVERLKEENRRLLDQVVTDTPDEELPEFLARQIRESDKEEAAAADAHPMSRGRELEKRRKFAEALSVYDAVGSEDPSYPLALRARARCLLQTGKTEEALKVLSGAVAAYPDDLHLKLLLGLAMVSRGQYNEAIPVLKQVVKASPSSVEARIGLGSALLGSGQYEPARADLEKALTLDLKSPEAHYNLAQYWMLIEKPDLEAARLHYRKSVELGGEKDSLMEDHLAPQPGT
ncbi:MAG: tetratricopeptide repeat protein [Lentisphaerota bacterium]